MSIDEWKKCTVKSHEVNSFLSSNIEFICKIVGTQGCSATCPFYMCKVKLSGLREQNRNIAATQKMSEIKQQAEIVQNKKTKGIEHFFD